MRGDEDTKQQFVRFYHGSFEGSCRIDRKDVLRRVGFGSRRRFHSQRETFGSTETEPFFCRSESNDRFRIRVLFPTDGFMKGTSRTNIKRMDSRQRARSLLSVVFRIVDVARKATQEGMDVVRSSSFESLPSFGFPSPMKKVFLGLFLSSIRLLDDPKVGERWDVNDSTSSSLRIHVIYHHSSSHPFDTLVKCTLPTIVNLAYIHVSHEEHILKKTKKRERERPTSDGSPRFHHAMNKKKKKQKKK